jgi:hypothetical protein
MWHFADLRFADWHTQEICGFAIEEGDQEFADLLFADFNKKVCLPTLDTMHKNILNSCITLPFVWNIKKLM